MGKKRIRKDESHLVPNARPVYRGYRCIFQFNGDFDKPIYLKITTTYVKVKM